MTPSPPTVTAPDDRNEEELARSRMTFGEHLGELRSRLIRSLLVSLLGLVVVFLFNQQVMAVVVEPYRAVMEALHQETQLRFFGPAQAFFATMKVCFVVALILTGPFWIYQLWAFVAAGLYRRERTVVYRYAPLCFVLFLSGVLFGYFFLIPIGLRFLLTFADPTLVQSWVGLSEYLSFFTVLTLVLGGAFQLPVVMLGLSATGVIKPDAFRKRRRYFIVAIFVVAAFLTPPDPVTQVLLAIPLCALYEFGILLAWLAQGAERPPMDWKLAWRRTRKVLIVLLLLTLLRQPLLEAWRRSRLEGRLMEAEAGRPELRSALAELLGEEVVALPYRVGAEGNTFLLAVCTRERARVVRVTQERRQSQVIDRKGRELTLTHDEAGVVTYVLTVPERVQLSEFVPDLLEGLEHGSEEVVAVVKPMLERLSGVQIQGEEDQVREAFRKWYQGHREESLKQ